MTVIGDVLTPTKDPVWVERPSDSKLISVRLYGKGAVQRVPGDGKSPKPFKGNRGKAGQFVFSRIWARRGAMAILPDTLDGVVVTNEFPLFDIDTYRLHPPYFAHMVRTERFLAELERISAGASGQNRIKEAAFLSIPVALPALPEQRRIAAVLDHADALRSKRRQVMAHLDSLTQSIFHDMFGDVADMERLDTVAQIQGGLQVSARRKDLPLAVPYLRVANVHRGRLDLSEVKTLKVTAAEVERTRLQGGDLLFVEGHANPLEVGRVAVWNTATPRCVHQNHLIRARLNPRFALPEFVAAWFNSEPGAAHFRRAGKTTSGLNTISASVVRSAPVPAVSLERQEQFAQRTGAVVRAREAQHVWQVAGNELFKSLQARAFRGEL